MVSKKNLQVIQEFRANGGELSVRPPNGPILLLHTRGARTGRSCLTPLIYSRDGDSYIILASRGGWKHNPAWYYNLLAQPNAVIEVGTETIAVTAEVVGGTERERLFASHASHYPQFDFYRRKTRRVIPVILLRRASATKQPAS